MMMYHHTKCFLHRHPHQDLHHGDNKTDDENDIDQKAKRTECISHEKTVPRTAFELVNPSHIVERQDPHERV